MPPRAKKANGRILLVIHADAHASLISRAEAEGTSVSALIRGAIEGLIREPVKGRNRVPVVPIRTPAPKGPVNPLAELPDDKLDFLIDEARECGRQKALSKLEAESQRRLIHGIEATLLPRNI